METLLINCETPQTARGRKLQHRRMVRHYRSSLLEWIYFNEPFQSLWARTGFQRIAEKRRSLQTSTRWAEKRRFIPVAHLTSTMGNELDHCCPDCCSLANQRADKSIVGPAWRIIRSWARITVRIVSLSATFGLCDVTWLAELNKSG